MPRQKNTVIVDVSDPQTVREAIDYFEERAKLVRASEEKVAQETAAGIRNIHIPQMLAILRTYPPKRDKNKKVRWTSPRQKAAYFVTNGFGQGIPYHRTGRLGAGWKSIVKVTIVARQVRLIVKTWNDALSPWKQKPYVRYVMGDFGSGSSRFSVARYMKPMQGFHQDTGWQPAYKDILFFYGRIRDYSRENYKRYYQRLFSGE